jgi:hypothetical protein
VIASLSPFVRRVLLHIDVKATVQRPVGLECYPPPVRAEQSRGELQWEPLVEHLVARRLCLPAKGEALLAYPGLASEQTDPDHWPMSLARVSALFDRRAAGLFVRKLDHVKIVHRPDRPLEAKAYLDATQRWAYGHA